MARKKLPKVEGKADAVECTVKLGDLKPHPRNYKSHPDDQLAHLRESLRQYGFYRRVIVASDDTILAGHGLVEAARGLEFGEVPALRFSFGPDDPRALKLVAIDNEVGRFGESDDRALSELLRDISREVDIGGLIGTGYDEKMLAALVMTTRPASEIASASAAAEWVGMPDYDKGGSLVKVIFTFDSEEERMEFLKQHGFLDTARAADAGAGKVYSVKWPLKGNADRKCVKFVDKGAP